MFTRRQTGFKSRLKSPLHVDCDPDSNLDSGPGARVNTAIEKLSFGCISDNYRTMSIWDLKVSLIFFIQRVLS